MKRENQDWHKSYQLGDIKFLLVCGIMEKELDAKHEGDHCIYVHYILNKDKYIAWLSFNTEKERDSFYLNDINDIIMDKIAKCAILNEPDEVDIKKSSK